MGYRDRKKEESPFERPSRENLRQIVQGEDKVVSARLTVEWGEKLGQGLVDLKLTTTQIRGIFGQVRRIEMGWPFEDDSSEYAQSSMRELMLLKPKIRYQAGREQERNRTRALSELAEVLVPAIDLVNNREHFQRFVDLFEAILAYHKALGGKE